MGQIESKENDQDLNADAQHARQNTHGSERSRRATPPVVNAGAQHQKGAAISGTPATPRQVQRRPATSRTLPRTRPLPIMRPNLTRSAQHPQAASTLRTSRRIQQEFAIRSAAAGPSPQSRGGETSATRRVIPSKKSAKNENFEQERGRSTTRRPATTVAKVDARTSPPDDTTSPPAKRLTRSSTVRSIPVETVTSATAGSSETHDTPLEGRPGAQESDETDEKILVDGNRTDDETDTDESEDEESDEETLSDKSEMSDGLDTLDNAESEVSEEMASVPRPTTRVDSVTDTERPFQLRRSRRRSVPVRRLQVNPRRATYVSL